MYEFSYVLVQFSILRNGLQVPQTNNSSVSLENGHSDL